MAWGALSLAIGSFIFIALGVLFTPVPGVGAVFSFGAPLLALAGIIVGGRAVSRSKAAAPGGIAGAGGAVMASPGSEGSGLALAAVIVSALAFVPAVITALTCGACNALCAAGEVSSRHNFSTGIDPFDILRGKGVLGAPARQGDGGLSAPAQPDGGAPAEPGSEPQLPPPPLAPGPTP